ncbi:MAG: AmmeMemoRadiSam system protein B [Candidatus Krumholzibacteria bacterium]
MTTPRVRKAAVAGSFYPGDDKTLRGDIDRFLNNVQSTPSRGRPVVIMAPHAGYVYSGQVAAHAYRLLQGTAVRTVVVISPSHMEHFPFASVFDGDTYETPLGSIEVDQELSDSVAGGGLRVRRSAKGHIQTGLPHQEHALEVQLPFLQAVLGDFRIVPIVMGDQDWSVCQDLGEALGPHLTRPDVAVVASSDLSHFYSYEVARRKDAIFCELLEGMDPRRLYDSVAEGECEACGAGPVIASLIAARSLGAVRCAVLSVANSGDITGELDRVVGYAAAVVTAQEGASTPGPPAEQTALDEGVQTWLLRHARGAIESALDMPVEQPPAGEWPILQEPRGVFVTLKSGSRLRGCIGNLEADRPLRQVVDEMARAAAFHDPRFPRVTQSEIQDLRIEISVLTPLRQITDVGDIRVGHHGLVIDDGVNRGLLLPQVAGEYGWDATTFLEHTCQKGALPRDAWKDDRTRIYVFSAQVFSE